MGISSNIPELPDANDRKGTELQLLLSDYVILRDDERNTVATQGVAVSIAVALIGGLVAFAGQSCALATNHSSCTNIPTVFLAGAPAIPFAALGFVILQGVVSVIRSYYIRLVELEIQARVPMEFAHFGKLAPMSFVGLTTEILSLRRGHWSYRALTAIIVLISTFTFGGITVYIAIHMDSTTRNLMLLLYSISFLLVAYQVYASVARGREFFLETVNNYNLNKNSLFTLAKGTPTGQRKVISYLIFPRVESIPKSVLPLAMFCIAASTTGAWQWGRFLVLWVILEYFVYAARYQWNDLRDFDADQLHPARDLRGRLPAGSSPRDTSVNIALSVMVLVLRLGLAAFIGIETGTLAQVGLIIATVFGVAICYEIMRSRLRRRRSPSGNNSGTMLAMVVWLALGPGYAIRGAVGLLAAHVRWTNPAFYIGLAGLMALGIMLVLMAWLLDVTSFFAVAADGTWHLKAAQPTTKTYAWALLRYVSIPIDAINPDPDHRSGNNAAETEGRQVELLKHRRTGWSPWNIAYMFATILICEFWVSLPGGNHQSVLTYCLTAAVSGAGATLMIYSNEQWKRWLVTIVFAGFVLLVSRATGVVYWLLPGIGWLAVAACYTSLCGTSFLDLVQALPRLRVRIVKTGSAMIETALGPTAFQYLQPRSRLPATEAAKPRRGHS